MDFDRDGTWNDVSQSGPVIHAPNYIKNIAVKWYRIEWLNISEPEIGFYSKNHMVATLIFAESVTINSVKYMSAHLSMELGKEKTVFEIVGQEVRMGPAVPT